MELNKQLTNVVAEMMPILQKWKGGQIAQQRLSVFSKQDRRKVEEVDRLQD